MYSEAIPINWRKQQEEEEDQLLNWRRSQEQQMLSRDAPQEEDSGASPEAPPPTPYPTPEPAQEEYQAPPPRSAPPVAQAQAQAQEEYAPAGYDAPEMTPEAIPAYSTGPEQQFAAPQGRAQQMAPQGPTPRQQAYEEQERATLAEANKKIPMWRQITAAIAPRFAGPLTGQYGLRQKEQALELQRRGVATELAVKKEADDARLREEQTAAMKESRLGMAAQRQAATKVAPTVEELSAMKFPDGNPVFTPEQITILMGGGKLQQQTEKPDRYSSSPQGIYNTGTGEVKTPAPAKEVADKETVNQWISDSLSSDPAVSGPAKQKIDTWKKTQHDQRQPIVNVNAIPSDPAIDQAAYRYLKSGELPALGMGRDAASARTKILNRAAELDPSADIATNKGGYGADKGSLASLQRTRDSINAFEGTARKNLDQFMNVAQKTVDSGFPFVNNVFRGGARVLGDPNAANFEAARTVAFTEIAKVLNNPTSSAVLSDSARKEAEKVLNGSYTVKQLVEVSKLLKQDMENRKVETDRALEEIRQRMRGGKSAPDGTSKSDPLGIR